MAILKRTAQAEEDLIQIWLFIGQDDPSAADRLIDLIEEKSQLLVTSPKLGMARPDVAPELRYFPVKKYLILYREIENGVEIVRVIHGSRHLPNILN